MKAALRGRDYAEQVQMLSPEGRGDSPPDVHGAAAVGVSTGGGALPYAAQIQRSFGGYDISHVQAHTSAQAQASAAWMGADAYATGHHVVLGAGGQDLHTVAHEAAHVVQQRAGVSLSGGVGQAGDAYERHADAVADRVVRGESAEDLLSQMSGGGSGSGAVQMRSDPLLERGTSGGGARRTRSTGGWKGEVEGYTYENPELEDHIATGHQGAREYAAHLATEEGVEDRLPQPLPEYLGYPEYYLARHQDFVRRHSEACVLPSSERPTAPAATRGGVQPPDYYLCYGYKYAMRFTNELFPELSPRGKAWLITARLNLQLAIEQRVLRDPGEFAALERSPDDFRDFCFGSHAAAYLDAGLANLPLDDLALIGTTPDIGDLFSTAGMAQVVEVAFGIAARQEAGVFGGAALVNGSWSVRRRLQEATRGKAQ